MSASFSALFKGSITDPGAGFSEVCFCVGGKDMMKVKEERKEYPLT
jgi:hypothetical protein